MDIYQITGQVKSDESKSELNDSTFGSLTLEEETERQSDRCGMVMRGFLSSPFMLILALLVSLNAVFFIISGYNWTVSVTFGVCLMLYSASLFTAFIDAKTKAAFYPRGLFFLSMSLKVQKAVVYCVTGFMLVYSFFAFLKVDLLFGLTGGFYKRLSSLELWCIPLILLTAFILYSAQRYLWRKGMTVENYRDAAEYGLIFGKGAAEYAGLSVAAAAARLILFIVKPAKWTGAKYIPVDLAEFLDMYGIGGSKDAVAWILTILNVVLLLYVAALSMIYFIKVKKFQKNKKKS